MSRLAARRWKRFFSTSGNWPDVSRVTAERRAPGKWKIRTVTDSETADADIGFDEFAAESGMNDVVSASVSGIRHRLWQLEYAKFAGVHLAGPLAGAHAMRDRMSSATRQVFSVRSTKAKAMAHALEQLTARRPALTTRGMVAAARMVFAAPLALAMIAASVIRHRNSAPHSVEGGVMIALHGEASNRTRHLLPPVFDPGPDTAFCIIGRPQASLAMAGRILDPKAGMAGRRVFYPFDVKSLLGALPVMVSHFAAGVGVAATAPILLPFRECVGICYRMGLGAVQAHWWRRGNLRPATVLFGHTGTADTTQLEWAMQQAGARTVHCVHGGSLGWNFAGYSTVGVFLNGHDAALAGRFPGYATSTYLPQVKPLFVPGVEDRWLLLTAYSHIMNPAYAYAGTSPDIEAMRSVASLARVAAPRPAELIWRPHPALRRLPAADQERLARFAAEAGFRPWPEDLPYDGIAGFGRIFSTPSTAALDALLLGRAVELVVTAPLVTETIYGIWPSPDDFTSQEAMFHAIWEAVRPGRFLADAGEVSSLVSGKS